MILETVLCGIFAVIAWIGAWSAMRTLRQISRAMDEFLEQPRSDEGEPS